MIVVGEDVSLARTETGRRGLAGTVMVHKICGAMAERGDSLEEIVRIGQACADAMGTVGASLTTCNIPGQPPDDRIAPGELELGLGIHGEPGRERRPAGTSREIAALLCDEVARPGRNESFEASADEDVVLMVNNLGRDSIELGAPHEALLTTASPTSASGSEGSSWDPSRPRWTWWESPCP